MNRRHFNKLAAIGGLIATTPVAAIITPKHKPGFCSPASHYNWQIPPRARKPRLMVGNTIFIAEMFKFKDQMISRIIPVTIVAIEAQGPFGCSYPSRLFRIKVDEIIRKQLDRTVWPFYKSSKPSKTRLVWEGDIDEPQEPGISDDYGADSTIRYTRSLWDAQKVINMFSEHWGIKNHLYTHQNPLFNESKNEMI